MTPYLVTTVENMVERFHRKIRNKTATAPQKKMSNNDLELREAGLFTKQTSSVLNKVEIQEIRSPMKRRRRGKVLLIAFLICLLVLVFLVIAVFLGAWFGGGAFLWDFILKPHKNSDCFDTLRDNRPWNYTLIDVIHFCKPIAENINTTEHFAPYFIPSVSNLIETVMFKSRDPDWIAGTGKGNIAGTFIPQTNVNSTSKFIILIHGIRACRFSYATLAPASMLYRKGYNILLIDMRNHGDSDIHERNPYASFGYYEHLDVLGALDYLISRFPFLNNQQPDVSLFGSSMGGSTAMIAFAREKRFRLLFSDSAPCDVYKTLFANAVSVTGSESFAQTAMYSVQSVALVKGTQGFPPFPLDPETLMKDVDLSGERKVFFFQTSGDWIVPDFNMRLCAEAAYSAAVKQNLDPLEKVKSYLHTVIYPEGVTTSRFYCANHLVSVFNNASLYNDILLSFF